MYKKQNNLMRFSRNERLAQLSEQEIVIEKKKREIQAKLEAQKKKQTEETLRKFKETKNNKPEFFQQSSCSGAEYYKNKNKDTSEEPVKESLTNAFSNDGSFLDHFKKLSQGGLPVNTDDIKGLTKQKLVDAEKAMDAHGEGRKEANEKGDHATDRDSKPFNDNSQPFIREPLESKVQFQIPPPGVVQLLPQDNENLPNSSAFQNPASGLVSSHLISMPQNSAQAFNSKNIQLKPFQSYKTPPPAQFPLVDLDLGIKKDCSISAELGHKTYSEIPSTSAPPPVAAFSSSLPVPPNVLPKHRSESISLTLKANTTKKLEAIPNPLGIDQEPSPPSPKKNLELSPKRIKESHKESIFNTTSLVENVSSNDRESIRISSAFKNNTEGGGKSNEVDEKWAELVAQYGDDFEESLTSHNQNDPSFSRLRPCNEEPSKKTQKLNPPESCDERSAEEVFSNDNRNSDEKRKRKRKSRWGDVVATTSTPMVAGVALQSAGKLPAPKSTLLSQLTRSDPGLIQYARQTFGSINLSEEDWKKAEDHYKINLLYQDMVKKKAEVEKLERQGKFKYEYDSDEDTEGGTWEHKLRQQEMQATQLWAEELTRQAAGKHHIGDFLPPEELERFMEKYNAVKEGREPDLSDYKEYKLKEDNVGYRLLQKMGWNEGQGLGQDGSGITNPVNKATTRHENQGLGIDRTDGLEAGDDEYDAYRKRMMLAYRFRPNPLNNPRRPYY